jgi:phospholipase C
VSREPGVRTDTDGGSQGGEAGLAHVVVLMLENRSFDHMFG